MAEWKNRIVGRGEEVPGQLNEIAYHRTTPEKLNGILRAGLLCQKATRKYNNLRGVWLGKTPYYHGIKLFGDVLLSVNIAGLKRADLNDNEWEICVTENIPPDRILFEQIYPMEKQNHRTRRLVPAYVR